MVVGGNLAVVVVVACVLGALKELAIRCRNVRCLVLQVMDMENCLSTSWLKKDCVA